MFSNLELRILAHIARDENLIDMFLSKEDPHSKTAIDMNTQHRLVKMGITPSELKKLSSVDKVLQYCDQKGVKCLVDGTKTVKIGSDEIDILKVYALLEKYFYRDGKDVSLKVQHKKLGDKDFLKMLWRLFKEAKDLRGEGKLLNFAIIYGFGNDAIAKALNLRTEAEGGKKKRDYFNAFRGVAKWLEVIRAEANRKGFVKTLLYKRRRKPSALQASNSPIQGTAGDIVKKAQIELGRNKALKTWGFHQLLQVHDEIVAEVREEHAERAKEVMQRLMEHPLDEDLIVPLVAEPEIGMTWNDAK